MIDDAPIRAWERDGILFERHDYAPGPAGELPRHAHAEYQFSYSAGFPGEYRYRGARHAVPVGSLTILHPGEAHVVSDPYDRDVPATYLMMYAEPEALPGRPFFSQPVILDAALVGLYVAMHVAGGLAHEELRAELFARLCGRSDRRPRGARAAVARARAHLEERYGERVRLQELAEVAHLSPYRLNRVFREEVGVPPHRYQLDLRIDRAKLLLARGQPIAAVAADVGFADQAHLTRNFSRLVGLPPSQYGKNVQDSRRVLA
jgi:AraC-like DNA-binding protein